MEIFRKYTGRKFIAMVLGVLVGVAVAFGAKGELIATVAGTVTSAASLIYYIFTEGKLDLESLPQKKEEIKDEEEKKYPENDENL